MNDTRDQTLVIFLGYIVTWALIVFFGLYRDEQARIDNYGSGYASGYMLGVSKCQTSPMQPDFFGSEFHIQHVSQQRLGKHGKR